jgi:phage shock protein PspC (stress-responsive transcriptional regulator)
MAEHRLMRSTEDKMIAGVCAGIAAYLGVDSVFVRLAFLLLFFASGVGLILYIILMIIMPSQVNLDRSGNQTYQDNFDEYSGELSENVKRVKQYPQGRSIAAGLLIIFGLFMLFSNFGWLTALSGGVFWAMILIGLGIYIITKQKRS